MKSKRKFQVALAANLVVLVTLTAFWLTLEVSETVRVAVATLLVFLVGINLALLDYTRK